MKNQNYVKRLNKDILVLAKHYLKLHGFNMSLLPSLWNLYRNQREALKKRKDWQQKGVHVPPFMIFSVTNSCNLNCVGCYQKAQGREKQQEISSDKMTSILEECRELGISIILISGGEPLMRKDLLPTLKKFPDIVFALFTNGMLLTDELISDIHKSRHIIPILSIEGYEKETDMRRGKGVYSKLRDAASRLHGHKVSFGISLTVNRNNFDVITTDSFIQSYIDLGCKIFFYVEYVPISEATEELSVTQEQRERLAEIDAGFRKKFSAVLFSFPGGEEEYGGCLAAGRGFIHVSASGKVEPCPFAPYSDKDLEHESLEASLSSKFMKAIRDNHDVLEDTRGGCSLWVKRDLVKKLLDQSISQ